MNPNMIETLRQIIEDKPLPTECPRCGKQLEPYKGTDSHGRKYDGVYCPECPHLKDALIGLIFIGEHTNKQGGGWKGYKSVDRRVYEITFDQEVGRHISYRLWDGQLNWTPPFNWEMRKGKLFKGGETDC